jgi:hypothetical protein
MMANISPEFYHGWVIRISQDQAGYFFQCWMSEQQTVIIDAQCFSTLDQALQAAKLRADLESVRLSLTAFLRGKLQFLLLNPEEQNALEHSIVQYIDAAKHQFS